MSRLVRRVGVSVVSLPLGCGCGLLEPEEAVLGGCSSGVGPPAGVTRVRVEPERLQVRNWACEGWIGDCRAAHAHALPLVGRMKTPPRAHTHACSNGSYQATHRLLASCSGALYERGGPDRPEPSLLLIVRPPVLLRATVVAMLLSGVDSLGVRPWGATYLLRVPSLPQVSHAACFMKPKPSTHASCIQIFNAAPRARCTSLVRTKKLNRSFKVSQICCITDNPSATNCAVLRHEQRCPSGPAAAAVAAAALGVSCWCG